MSGLWRNVYGNKNRKMMEKQYWQIKLTAFDAELVKMVESLTGKPCEPKNGGNNKSEWIRKLATDAAHILCEIETIQAIKGDGIYQC